MRNPYPNLPADGAPAPGSELDLLRTYNAQKQRIEDMFKAGDHSAMSEAQRELSRLSIDIYKLRRAKPR